MPSSCRTSTSYERGAAEQWVAAVEGAWCWGILSCRLGWAEALVKAGPSQLNPVLGGPTAGSGMSDTSWLEIEAWLATHAPDMLQRLPAGADPKALRDLEDRLALQLPQSLLQSLLRHDGSGEQALHEYGCFCSTAQVLALWE